MKKWLLLLAVLLVLAAGVLFVRPGFETRTDVCLQDFSVSGDGSVMTIRTSLFGSMGYIRAVKTEQSGGELYCFFYSTFGGMNSSIGAQNRFELPLDAAVEKIYFDRGRGCVEPVLTRSPETGTWILA